MSQYGHSFRTNTVRVKSTQYYQSFFGQLIQPKMPMTCRTSRPRDSSSCENKSPCLLTWRRTTRDQKRSVSQNNAGAGDPFQDGSAFSDQNFKRQSAKKTYLQLVPRNLEPQISNYCKTVAATPCPAIQQPSLHRMTSTPQQQIQQQGRFIPLLGMVRQYFLKKSQNPEISSFINTRRKFISSNIHQQIKPILPRHQKIVGWENSHQSTPHNEFVQYAMDPARSPYRRKPRPL